MSVRLDARHLAARRRSYSQTRIAIFLASKIETECLLRPNEGDIFNRQNNAKWHWKKAKKVSLLSRDLCNSSNLFSLSTGSVLPTKLQRVNLEALKT